MLFVATLQVRLRLVLSSQSIIRNYIVTAVNNYIICRVDISIKYIVYHICNM